MAKHTTSKPKSTKPQIDESLQDMGIRVNEFGEIIKDYNIDDINAFLNQKVKDKKLEEPEKP